MLKVILSSLVILISFNALSSNAHKEHEEHEEKLDGFKLNAAGIKTFEIKTINYIPQKTMIPKSAIYKGLDEVNIYRVRAGVYKRVDFKTLSQNKNDFHISSADLNSGDQIVVNGIGFLRMAEIAASGGLADSHSH